jgi:hypothetical protein
MRVLPVLGVPTSGGCGRITASESFPKEGSGVSARRESVNGHLQRRQNFRGDFRKYLAAVLLRDKAAGMNRSFLATALLSIVLGAGSAGAQPICGDVNDSGDVTTTDALSVLRAAVGQPVDLLCDACGSLCPGDPRYLLGDWVFESEFGETVYENNYELVAVDEVNCEIVGEDLDDRGIAYAYAGTEYDYVLLSPNETYCDLFVFDYVGPDDVEGINYVLDVVEFGGCNFDEVIDEGPMIGERVGDVAATSTDTSTAAPASKSEADESVTPAISVSTIVAPKYAALVDRARARYEARKR